MPLREIQQQLAASEIKDFNPMIHVVRFDDAEADAGVGVPDANHLVVTRGGDEAAVVAELGTSESLGVAAELADAAAGIDIPQPDAEIAATAYDDITAQLDGVDGPGVAVQMAVQGAGGAVEDGDGAVFGAGDDVGVVEGEVEDRGGVVGEPAEGEVGVGDGVDDACSVGGAGDEDGGVVLEAEDGGVV
ncbi:hypothetical protein V502_09915, partial [Pseudogymnoascus sp. VKM F-4520 (FW-2644)]